MARNLDRPPTWFTWLHVRVLAAIERCGAAPPRWAAIWISPVLDQRQRLGCVLVRRDGEDALAIGGNIVVIGQIPAQAIGILFRRTSALMADPVCGTSDYRRSPATFNGFLIHL